MRHVRFKLDAVVFLLFAAVYYVSDTKVLAAVLLPIIVHELGHILTLRLLGLKIREIRAELKGLCIVYSGYSPPAGHAAAAIMGPAAGFAYTYAASRAGGSYGDWLCLSAGASLVLSVFNLLPALPLDGGRILLILCRVLLGEKMAAAFTGAVSLAVSALLLAAGLWLMLRGGGVAPVLAAAWLFLCQDAIVKSGEIL